MGLIHNRQRQIPMNARLELDLNVQVQLQSQLQPVLLHHVLGFCLCGGLLRWSLLRHVVALGVAHGDLAAHGARVGDGAVHRFRRRWDSFEGLHFCRGRGGGVAEFLCGGVFAHGGHGLRLGLPGAFGSLLLAAAAAGLGSASVAGVLVGVGVGHCEGGEERSGRGVFLACCGG